MLGIEIDEETGRNLAIIEAIFVELFFPKCFDPDRVEVMLKKRQRRGSLCPELPRCTQISSSSGRVCRNPANAPEGMCASHWAWVGKGHRSVGIMKDWKCIFCGRVVSSDMFAETCEGRGAN